MPEKYFAINRLSEETLQQFPAGSSLGKQIRQQEAAQLISAMKSAEFTVEQSEQRNRQIQNRLHRMTEEHRLNMDYLIRFGIKADQRQQLLAILEQVEQQGNFTLQQAIDHANEMARAQIQQSPAVNQIPNGLSGLGDV